jgi:23S rRNA (guanosine2251-2'-O)-methyltransferase
MEKVFGVHAAQALLDSRPKAIKKAWLLCGRDDPRFEPLRSALENLPVELFAVDRNELDEMVEGNHQGVILEVSPAEVYPEGYIEQCLAVAESNGKVPLVLVLDQVQDPHNLGACIRSADAAGVDLVIAPRKQSASLTSTVRKVACGACETTPFVQVTNLSRTLKKLQEAGLWVVGAAGEADKSLYEQDFTVPTALVMGAEGKGMRRLTREHCDHLASLPMAGGVSSLNVSVATGIFLFEAVRQRRQ